jgi:PRC-barrel domain
MLSYRASGVPLAKVCTVYEVAMSTEDASTSLRYLPAGSAEIAGSPCKDITIRAASGDAVGRLQGFIVDPIARRLRYFVVRTGGLLSKARLLPIETAGVDLGERTIDLLDDAENDHGRPTQLFRPELFPRFSDDDLLATLFSGRDGDPVAASG